MVRPQIRKGLGLTSHQVSRCDRDGLAELQRRRGALYLAPSALKDLVEQIDYVQARREIAELELL